MNSTPQKKNVLFIIILASFGYFVDIYDLVIFSIVRVKSFTEIGISGEAEMLKNTQYVLNIKWQVYFLAEFSGELLVIN